MKAIVRILIDVPETLGTFMLAQAIALALQNIPVVPRPYYMEVEKGNGTTRLNNAWLSAGLNNKTEGRDQ